jgi:hypothetical protein
MIMKNQLLEELSVLHVKVASLKFYDADNVVLLKQYGHDFEAILTHLLTFNADKFKGVSDSYHNILSKNASTDLDVHDDTANSSGFYDSVAALNTCINHSIETINSL